MSKKYYLHLAGIFTLFVIYSLSLTVVKAETVDTSTGSAKNYIRLRNQTTVNVTERTVLNTDFVQEQRDEIIRKREEFRQTIKERTEAMRTELQQKREEFKLKLEEIRDERKKKIVERVEQRINTLNEKAVGRLTKHLERLEEILAKIESRAKKMAENGIDITEVNSKIASIKTNIESAKSAVSGQAAKTYVPELTTEENLGSVISSLYQQFHSDIKNLRDMVHNIRKEIADLVRTMSSLRGTNTEGVTNSAVE